MTVTKYTSITVEQRTQMAAQFTAVPEEVRSLIFLAVAGICPYCFAHTGRDVSTAALIRQGLVGNELATTIAEIQADDARNKIDPDTGHAVDCPAAALVKAMLVKTTTGTP